MASTSSLFASSTRLLELNRSRRHTMANITTTFAKRREIHDRNFDGRSIVDKNMIVLRKRIREMQMADDDEPDPTAGWMDWEKDIYPSYNTIICDSMRFLQSYLMDTRPSIALGLIGLVALSVPISIGVVILNLLELSRGVLSAVHLSYVLRHI